MGLVKVGLSCKAEWLPPVGEEEIWSVPKQAGGSQGRAVPAKEHVTIV